MDEDCDDNVEKRRLYLSRQVKLYRRKDEYSSYGFETVTQQDAKVQVNIE
jgi:hypothetical protein